MKRIISLICVIAVLGCVICSCGEKAGEFVKIDADSLNSLAWISGSTNMIGDEDAEKIISIYNALEPTGGVSDKSDKNAEWRVLATVMPEGENPCIFRLSYIGNFEFVVRVDGSHSSAYKITSEELYNAFIETK